ncbi:MAG: cation-translocating P-type ATPase [Bacteroidia bacterium]
MNTKTVLQVEGMTCNSCANTVTKYLNKKGLQDVQVDFVSGEVAFKNPEENNLTELVNGINGLGYRVVNDNIALKKASRYTSLEKLFALCLLFTIPLLAHMFLPFEILHNALFQLTLCLPVIAIGFYKYGKGAFASVRMFSPNMDVLILTGTTAAFIYSCISIFLNGVHTHDVFFETAASIITFVTLGNIIEQRSVRQTKSAIEELKKMQPASAKKILNYGKANETITELAITSIMPMDYILINEGEAITVDGKIKWGSATVDESMLTGESKPLVKEINDEVFAGTTLIKGTIKVLTQKSADATVLSGIIELVKKAQSEKPSIQRIGDRVSAVFVPVVIAIAIIAFLILFFAVGISFTQSMLNSIAVLVIACPCAMGLATPTAIAVGVGRAAKNGMLFKSAQGLEILSAAKTIVFDKTGTLTNGNFTVTDFKTDVDDPDSYREEIASLIISIEKHSSHPIAKSLVIYFEKKFPDASNLHFAKVDEIKGLGIIAVNEDGDAYKIGSAIFCEVSDVAPFNIYLTKNNQSLASIAIDDELRENAKDVIRFLKSKNIKTVLLSGDTQEKCNTVNQHLNIDVVYGNQSPQSKFEKIKEYKKSGGVVMIGDGINDAPSLAASDLGVSLINSSQIAINAAQLLLLKEDLFSLVSAYNLSTKTISVIKQNLFWAILYNVITIPLAASGYVPPLMAVFSMALSDVVVVGNSLRLKWVGLA